MTKLLPYAETEVVKHKKMEPIHTTANGSVIGYFVEVDLKYTDKKTISFPFCPESGERTYQFLQIQRKK